MRTMEMRSGLRVLRNKVFFQRVMSMSAHLHNTHMCMDRSHFVKTPT